MTIHYSTLGPLDPTFTFIQKDGSNLNISVKHMRAWLAMQPSRRINLTPVDPHLVAQLISENAVSRERVKQLHDKYVVRGERMEPVIIGLTPTGMNDGVLMDGGHRYIFAAAMRLPLIECHILQEREWRPFELVGMPDLTKEELAAVPTLHHVINEGL